MSKPSRDIFMPKFNQDNKQVLFDKSPDVVVPGILQNSNNVDTHEKLKKLLYTSYIKRIIVH